MIDNEEYKFGDWFQRKLDDLLQQRGWYTIASYDYSGDGGSKPPRLYGHFGKHVIPDIDVARAGARFWCEAKAKNAATLYRKTNVLEHGFSLRHFNDYLHVQSITGAPVYVFVYESETGAILCISLDKIEAVKRVYVERKMGRGGMIFFPRGRMTPWATRHGEGFRFAA